MLSGATPVLHRIMLWLEALEYQATTSCTAAWHQSTTVKLITIRLPLPLHLRHLRRLSPVSWQHTKGQGASSRAADWSYQLGEFSNRDATPSRRFLSRSFQPQQMASRKSPKKWDPNSFVGPTKSRAPSSKWDSKQLPCW